MKLINDCKSGKLVYCTRPFTSAARAAAFAKCVNANSRFTGAEVRTHGRQTVVIYQAARPARQMAVWAAHSAARRELAATSMPAYLWDLQTNEETCRAWYLCQSTSGETYEVTHEGCTCPDFTFRGSVSGIPCKHIEALKLALTAGMRSLFDVGVQLCVKKQERAAQKRLADLRAEQASLYALAPRSRRA